MKASFRRLQVLEIRGRRRTWSLPRVRVVLPEQGHPSPQPSTPEPLQLFIRARSQNSLSCPRTSGESYPEFPDPKPGAWGRMGQGWGREEDKGGKNTSRRQNCKCWELKKGRGFKVLSSRRLLLCPYTASIPSLGFRLVTHMMR